MSCLLPAITCVCGWPVLDNAWSPKACLTSATIRMFDACAAHVPAEHRWRHHLVGLKGVRHTMARVCGHGLCCMWFEVALGAYWALPGFLIVLAVILSPRVRQATTLPPCLNPRFSPHERLRLSLVASYGPRRTEDQMIDEYLYIEDEPKTCVARLRVP